jgi:DNA-binding CsgD family transcriptional regulator
MVVAGDASAGAAALRAAAATLASAPAPLDHAAALVDLGEALCAAGDLLAAREPLAEALAAADACGAEPLAGRARAALVATGARPRRRAVRGADALTPSERRVAMLAAEGLSNRSIADTLFVTENTVEKHLSAAYRKLGIATRSQLGGALEATSPAG